MRRTFLGALMLVVYAPALRAQSDKEKNNADKPPTPAKQVQALQRDFDKAFKQLLETQDKLTSIPRQILDLAEKHPSDPGVVDGLLFVIQNPFVAQDPRLEGVQQKALALLIRHHPDSPKIGPISSMVLQMPDGEKQLRTILEKSKHREVQGPARLALAKHLKEKSEEVTNLADALKLTKEAEELFDQVATKYADIKSGDSTLGEAAKPELFELRNLALGKTAPDIGGEDSDGKKFRLSDYRGKVVVLDFWARW